MAFEDMNTKDNQWSCQSVSSSIAIDRSSRLRNGVADYVADFSLTYREAEAHVLII